MDKVLKDVFVLDFSRFLAAPYCGQLLADMGARVIRVEKPGGGVDRQFGLMGPDGESIVFKLSARNKEGITLDVMRPEGQELLSLLLQKTDVIIHNFTPGSPELKVLDYESLNQKHPGLIMAAVSGYGAYGPYAKRTAFDPTTKAMSGEMWLNGMPGGPPFRAIVPYVDLGAGTQAAFGIMLALYHRQKTGQGQYIDVALLDIGATYLQYVGSLLLYTLQGEERRQLGNHGFGIYMNCFETNDGWVTITPGGDSLWAKLCNLIGCDDMITDPRFLHDNDRRDNSELVDAVLEPWFKDRTVAEALGELHKARIPAERVDSIVDLMNNPQVKAREAIIYDEYSGIGKIPMPGVLPKLSVTPGGVDRGAPQSGEHNMAIYRDMLGISQEQLSALEKKGVI